MRLGASHRVRNGWWGCEMGSHAPYSFAHGAKLELSQGANWIRTVCELDFGDFRKELIGFA